MRIEPPPSLALPIGTIPADTAAAAPADEVPAVRSRFQGLRVALHPTLKSCIRVRVSWRIRWRPAFRVRRASRGTKRQERSVPEQIEGGTPMALNDPSHPYRHL
jgi:hypothetical protein